jgi:uncharacterized membrane protein
MILSRSGFYLTIFLSVIVAMATLRVLPLGFDLSFPDFGVHLTERRGMFLAHVLAASVALLLGGFQFSPTLRARALPVHRWLGRAYVLAVLIGGLSGLVIGSQAVGGPIAAVGFSLLAISWLGSTAVALWFIRVGNIAAHRRWMIRSFALTFAAVTLRIYLLIFGLNGFEYAEASVYLAWMCWVPNLVFAEWLVRR